MPWRGRRRWLCPYEGAGAWSLPQHRGAIKLPSVLAINQGVRSRTSVAGVDLCPAVEEVGAVVAEQPVGTLLTEDSVIAVPAHEGVPAQTTEEHVPDRGAPQDVDEVRPDGVLDR